MNRPQIPAEVRRAVLVEAGHRCAIPRCGQTEIDIHHITPWESCRRHDLENLIALCPICHRRAHQGDIDRKSLLIYKAKLIADFGKNNSEEFSEKIIEIKRRISETENLIPGYYFNFDFPDFKEPHERIVSRNLEAWGNELLVQYREGQENYEETNGDSWTPPPNELKGNYIIIRRDSRVISIKYTLYQYYSGAAHGSNTTHVQNFLLKPFQPVTLKELLKNNESLTDLSLIIRSHLLSDKNYDPEWVVQGTKPEEINFSNFNLDEFGILFTFSEYQITCFAAGEQELFVSYYELENIINSTIYRAVTAENL